MCIFMYMYIYMSTGTRDTALLPQAHSLKWTRCGHLPTPLATVRPVRVFTIRVGSRDEVIAISCLKACTAADATPGSPRRRGACRNQAGLVFRPDGSSPSPPAPPRYGPGTVFLPGKEVFARPGPAAPSQVPQMRYPSRQQAPPQWLDL